MKTLTLIFILLAATTIAAQPPTQKVEADLIFQTAYVQYKAQKLDEAAASCLQVIKLNPSDFRAYGLLGFINLHREKWDVASEYFGQAVKLKPDAKDLLMMKSEVDYRRDATDEALAAARQVIQLDPNYASAHMMIGAVLKDRKGQEAEAIAAYQKAVQLNPQFWDAYEELGEIFEQQENYKQAEDSYHTAMTTDPRGMAGRFKLGRLLVKQDRLTEARELWDHRVSDEDNTRPTFIDLLTRAENLKKATAALAAAPNDPAALVDMGIAVMDGDHWVIDKRQDRAIVYFRKALAVKPDYARAQYQIVKAYVQIVDMFTKETKKLEAELKKLKAMDPKLADEMVEYRKTYQGGFRVLPVN